MADEQQPTEPFDLSRRDFVTLSVAAGLAAAEGATAEAQAKVMEMDVQVKTPDGTCDAALIHPATGSHPAVIIWPDAFGLRPSMRDMGKRLAAEGYTVLVPNPYYRVTKAPGIQMEGFSFQNADNMAALRKLMGGILARHGLGHLLNGLGRYDEALAEAHELLRRDPNNKGSQRLLAAIQNNRGEFGEVLAIYEKHLSGNPAQPTIWMSYGHILKTVGRTDEAIAAYRRAIELDSADGWFYHNLSLVHESLNQFELPVSSYQQALEHHRLEHDRAVSWHNLGNLPPPGPLPGGGGRFAPGDKTRPTLAVAME